MALAFGCACVVWNDCLRDRKQAHAAGRPYVTAVAAGWWGGQHHPRPGSQLDGPRRRPSVAFRLWRSRRVRGGAGPDGGVRGWPWPGSPQSGPHRFSGRVPRPRPWAPAAGTRGRGCSGTRTRYGTREPPG
ncbi:helix-turn-helix domain-containing protein [Streptomyces fungicidicus]